jgi:hypothetical protein
MKLLFENWRKVMEGDVVSLPTSAHLSAHYDSYIQNLDAAIRNLIEISSMFKAKGSVLEEINGLLVSLKSARDNEMLKFDVESLKNETN